MPREGKIKSGGLWIQLNEVTGRFDVDYSQHGFPQQRKNLDGDLGGYVR
jgi:hypothetical protein